MQRIIPAGLLAQRKGDPGCSADAEARSRVEGVAMQVNGESPQSTVDSWNPG